MPDFTLIRITETFLKPNGLPATGSVNFTLTATMTNTVTGAEITTQTLTAKLDLTGAIDISLYSTDDPTTTPVGVTYKVEESFGLQRVYYINVPHNAVGAAVNLGLLMAQSPRPIFDYGITGVTSVNETVAIARLEPGKIDLAVAVPGGGSYATTAQLNSEISTRAAADTANATAITTEATTRATADSTNATAITTEATARATADALLEPAITVLPITKGGTGFNNKASGVIASFPADGYQVQDFPYAVTLATPTVSNPSGATLTHQIALAASPTVFTTCSFPQAFALGDKLKVTAVGVGVGSYVTCRFSRTA